MTLLLTDLPSVLLQNILWFAASDTKTLLNCERSCKTLQKIVKDDETWKQSRVPVLSALVEAIPSHIFNGGEPLPRSFFKTHREYACVMNAIRVSWREQNHSENILLDVLGAEQFAAMIHGDSRLCTPSSKNVCGLLQIFAKLETDTHRFDFRGDTLFTLVELVSATMIGILSQANEVSCMVAAATSKYPIMTSDIFTLGTKSFSKELMPTIYDTADHEMFVDATCVLLPELVRDTIILRLSHRAGIIRMDTDVFKLAWGTLIHTILLLLRPACFEMVGSSPLVHIADEKRRILLPNESIHTVPPFSIQQVCSICHEVAYLHTIVPKQLEDSAKKLGLPFKVYGDYWMLEDESHPSEMSREEARDTRIAKAEERYDFQDSDEESSQGDQSENSLNSGGHELPPIESLMYLDDFSEDDMVDNVDMEGDY